LLGPFNAVWTFDFGYLLRHATEVAELAPQQTALSFGTWQKVAETPLSVE
jgi:hypothetical protein